MQTGSQRRSLKFMALNRVGKVGCIGLHAFYTGESLKRATKMAKANSRNWFADVRADIASTVCPVDVGTS